MLISLKKIFPYAGIVIVVIIVGYFARQNHINFETSIVDKVRFHLLDTVRARAESLNRRVLNLTQELEILSENKIVQEAFSDGYSGTSVEAFSFLDDSYKDIKSLADSLSAIDARDVVIYEAPFKGNIGKSLSPETDIRKELINHQTHASGIVNVAAGMPVLIFDQPVFSRDKFVGFLQAVIGLETLQATATRNDKGERYSFLLDQDDRFLSYPDRHYLGKSLSALSRDNHISLEKSGFETLVGKINSGEEGSGKYQLLSLDDPQKKVEVIVAFSPLSFGGKTWSLVSVIDYDAIAGPVKKNARENIIFAGIVIFVLFLSAAIFYRDMKRKNKKLRAVQSLLIQSAKMEVVGKLAAGVAHEVKNPLAIILMSVDFLKNNVKSEDEDVRGSLVDAENAVNRADTIIRGLLDFSASSELEMKMQDIHALIDKSVLLVKHARDKNNVRVTRNFGKDIPDVSVDRNKIEQVFINLFMNAIQAMMSGGELQIKTSRAGASAERQMVVVQIEDAGTGIPESIEKDLFVPFVTTKRGLGGTGLGLSIVKNIMEMHGGKITLENKPDGQGVRAILWFKITQEAV